MERTRTAVPRRAFAAGPRPPHAAALGLCALAALSPGAASAQTISMPDVRNVRPLMMLLVDTSGSMERKPLPADGTGCGDCKPVCSGTPAADATQKNRWAITLEALTGTFDSFRCYERDRSTSPFVTTDYDYGYFLPHYDFFGTEGETPSTQLSDGLIDGYDATFKFGLMTFDGVGTTIGGDTLVPYSPYWTDPSYLAQANGAPGMWSYGRIGRLSFPGCTDVYGFNAGSRGPAPSGQSVPGALITVSASDEASAVSAVNASIKDSLRQVRPYGGTPIAAMLDDLEYYLNNDPSVRQGSDPYFICRQRYAVLLTDGAPDKLFDDTTRFRCRTPGGGLPGLPCAGSGCECPYDTETDIASRLVQTKLTRLFVVGYNVDDPSANDILTAIAHAGGSSSGALLAADGHALQTAIADAFHAAAPAAASRSVPVSIQTSALGGNTYNVTSGFQVGATATDPWYGLLYRRRIACSATTNDVETESIDTSKHDDFAYELNGQATRRVYTSDAPGRLEARGTLYGDYTPELVQSNENTLVTVADLEASSFGISQTRNLHRAYSSDLTDTAPTPDSSVSASVALGQALESSEVAQVAFTDTGSDALDPLLFDAAGTTDVSAVVDYVLARSGARATHKLGDIVHSNPVVMKPVTALEARYITTDTGYAGWLSAVASTYTGGGTPSRPGVLFVGSNDGILHAFNLEDWRAVDAGSMPGDWLSNGSLKGGVEMWGYVPPALYNKMPSMISPSHQWMFDGTPVVKDVVLVREAGALSRGFYRTVLVAPVRGAPAFVALDVTFPDRPRFMWQRTFGNLGNTVGQPALTQVNVAWDGSTPQQRAVAILPGGSGTLASSSACSVQAGDLAALAPNSDARSQVRCWQQRGRALYVVDAATGKLLQEFDSRHFPSPLVGAVVVDGLGTAVSRAAYFSDADGVLWRLSMVSKNPSDWVVMPIFDMFHGAAYDAGRPATFGPSLARDPRGNLVLVAGTGDLDNLTDPAAHRVVSLTEWRTVLASTTSEVGDLPDPEQGDLESPRVNWEVTLREGESVTGPMALFEDVIYFGTFESPTASSGDACQTGTSRIYGAHVRLRDPAQPSTHAPKPELFDAGDPNNSTDDTYLLSEVIDPTGTSLVLGLTVDRDPVCTSSQATFNYLNPTNFTATGAASGGSFQLHALVSGGGQQTQGSSQIGGSQLREFTRGLQVATQVSSVGFAGAVE